MWDVITDGCLFAAYKSAEVRIPNELTILEIHCFCQVDTSQQHSASDSRTSHLLVQNMMRFTIPCISRIAKQFWVMPGKSTTRQQLPFLHYIPKVGRNWHFAGRSCTLCWLWRILMARWSFKLCTCFFVDFLYGYGKAPCLTECMSHSIFIIGKTPSLPWHISYATFVPLPKCKFWFQRITT